MILALKYIFGRYKRLTNKYFSIKEKQYYNKLLSELPSITYKYKNGVKVISTAKSWEYVLNEEFPEFYSLFPYDLFGEDKPNFDIALNTWKYGESNDSKKFLQSWSQIGVFAAKLCLREESMDLMVKRMNDSKHRFPAFGAQELIGSLTLIMVVYL